MQINNFFREQVSQIKRGGAKLLIRKIIITFYLLFQIPIYFLAPVFVFLLRMLRPFILIRVGCLIGTRIGHFAANTELYLCERDAGINVPSENYIDIFYIQSGPLCNKQLKLMWKRQIYIWPAWFLMPIYRINRIIPGGNLHEVPPTIQHDRDVNNLLEKFPSHLQFSNVERALGEAGLLAIGLPKNAKYICLIVRDSAYLSSQFVGYDFKYHNYRDSEIQNYVLAAEALANRGYYVIRMGAKVHSSINSPHPLVIDYASNGMRSDFMDIYLGAHCQFCISVGTGFDAIPIIFRRPVVYVNMAPVGYMFTFCKKFIVLCKHYLSAEDFRKLSLREVLDRQAGFILHSSEYEAKNIVLMENTPEEILDAAIEMADYVEDVCVYDQDDEVLQEKFWSIFPSMAKDEFGIPLHGEIKARYSAKFLRNNPWWLQ